MAKEYKLYGDGIHDDTAAIQEMLDTSSEVRLPAPKVHYLISRPLELASGRSLVLPRYAEIRLAPMSNCVMIKNKTVEDRAHRAGARLFAFLDLYSPDAPCENISVEGGIWNFNNKEQNANPLSTGRYEPEGYAGFIMLFYNVRGLRLSSLTLKDTCTFGITMDRVSYFKISDITFDYNDGNPAQSNMDGIHLNGNCHLGSIEGLFGTCYDDIVALNAEEGSRGPITNVDVRGIYTVGSYSAVRLLSASPACAIRNVHISDVHGTFYHFGISMQHYYETGERGLLENITVENISAAKSDRNLVKFNLVHKYRRYGIIDIEGKNDLKNIRISRLSRCEEIDPAPTVLVFKDAVVDGLILDDIRSENLTGSADMPLLSSKGEIKNLTARDLYENGKHIEL